MHAWSAAVAALVTEKLVFGLEHNWTPETASMIVETEFDVTTVLMHGWLCVRQMRMPLTDALARIRCRLQ